jgi:hypothetical protein
VQEELASVLKCAGGPAVVPVLLDGHAKENWLLPLVSDRNAVDLTVGKNPIAAVADQVAKLVVPEGLPRMGNRRSYDRRGHAVGGSGNRCGFFLGAVLREGPDRSGWRGAIGLTDVAATVDRRSGVLVGYLSNMARK